MHSLHTHSTRITYLGEGQEVKISDELKKAGYPLESRHSFMTLRQELVDAFVE